MINKEDKQALLKSQLNLFLGVLRKRVSGVNTDFKGICIKDVDGTAYALGVCGSSDRPRGVNETVSTDRSDSDVSEMDVLLRGVQTDEQRARGLPSLIEMNNGTAARHLLEIFSERYLSVTIMGEVVFPEEQRIALCERIRPVVQSEIDQILDDAEIDRQALSIIDKASPSYKAYAFYAVKGDARVLRHQAAASYPILANVMADIMTVRQAIDGRMSLQSALMNTSPVNANGTPVLTKAMLKKLAGRNFSQTIPYSALRALSEIPIDWFPKTDTEMHYAVGIIDNYGFLTGGDIHKLLAPSSGRFESYAKSLALAYADTRSPDGATEMDMEYLSKVVNFKEIEKLSKKGDFDDIRKAARFIKDSDAPLPSNVTHKALHDYIIRSYAPDYSVDSMRNTHATCMHIMEIMERRVTAPLIASLSGRDIVPVVHELISGARDVAMSFLLHGKSPSTALEHFRKLDNQVDLLMYGETKKYEVEELSEEDEAARVCALGGYLLTEEDKDIMRTAMAYSGKQEWATDFRPLRINDVVIVPLLSTEDLTYEGEVMSNCISDYYAVKARDRHSAMLSIRRITDTGVKNLATVEYIGGSVRNYRLSAALGFGNSYSLPLDAKNMLIQFNNRVVIPLNEKMKRDDLSANPVASGNAVKKDGLDALSGYDWRKRRLIERAMLPWTGYIARDFRMPIERLAVKDVVKNAITAINPRASRADDIIYR